MRQDNNRSSSSEFYATPRVSPPSRNEKRGIANSTQRIWRPGRKKIERGVTNFSAAVNSSGRSRRPAFSFFSFSLFLSLCISLRKPRGERKVAAAAEASVATATTPRKERNPCRDFTPRKCRTFKLCLSIFSWTQLPLISM